VLLVLGPLVGFFGHGYFSLFGALADRFGIGSALAVTSVFFVAGAGLVLLLPETRGRELT
jgi:hypothetical protein